MARSKYTFEKRQREKARRLKQIEKASKRMKAKQQKADVNPEMSGENSDQADLESDSQSLFENTDGPR
jgi:hypothetical protein